MSRAEEKLLRKKHRKRKFRNLCLLFICFMLFIIMIYVTDAKTSNLVLKKDGKHAVYLDIENDSKLRVDVAGETYRFNIEKVLEAVNSALKWSREVLSSIVKKLGS
ncbi:hypothetical protein [Lutispora thermophila]|uniref:Uncharacterized protein n=1 Tax=Lutispora thermophila DSM 19022 TaxID=1122184 RepID=A0A1M6DC76_9FIRM|nr:hypothetical protein [Lutispora thermophila]SHI70750.1 hypothetical protein SAMN02745176_01113 [Lutispora thermophila DSM 19022]